MAAAAARSLGFVGEAFLAAELKAKGLLALQKWAVARVVVVPRLDLTEGDVVAAQGAGSPLKLIALSTTSDTAVDLFCQAAHLMLCAMAERNPPPPAALTPGEVDRGPEVDSMRAWELAQARLDADDAGLKQALLRGATGPAGIYAAEWAARVLADDRPPAEGVPLDLRRGGDPVRHKDISRTPFSERFEPVATERVPRPVAQAPSQLEARRLEDMLEPSAVAAIYS